MCAVISSAARWRLGGAVRPARDDERLAEAVERGGLRRSRAEAAAELQRLFEQGDGVRGVAGRDLGAREAREDRALAAAVLDLAEHGERPLLRRDRLLDPALAQRDEAELRDGLGLATAVARVDTQGARLPEPARGLGEAPESVLDDAEFLEGDRAAALVGELVEQGEGLAQIAAGLGEVRLREAERAEQVQRTRLPEPLAVCAAQAQHVARVGPRRVELAERALRQREPVQHARLPDVVAGRAEEREGLLLVLDRLREPAALPLDEPEMGQCARLCARVARAAGSSQGIDVDGGGVGQVVAEVEVALDGRGELKRTRLERGRAGGRWRCCVLLWWRGGEWGGGCGGGRRRRCVLLLRRRRGGESDGGGEVGAFGVEPGAGGLGVREAGRAGAARGGQRSRAALRLGREEHGHRFPRRTHVVVEQRQQRGVPGLRVVLLFGALAGEGAQQVVQLVPVRRDRPHE